MARKKTRREVIRVGIDFGTTHTIVALDDRGNQPILSLAFDHGRETLTSNYAPTAVTRFQDRYYHGLAAVHCFLDHYDQGAVLFPSLKRTFKDWYEGKKIVVGEDEADVADLATGFLTEIRQSILKALDLKDALIEAVIAVPANASSSQRFVTLSCFKAAGFKVLRILDEPVASGIQFVHERYKRWDRVEADVLIYDLGGGTFDTTLLSIHRGRYDPLRTSGEGRLGGDDFDAVLLDLVEQSSGIRFEGREKVEMMQRVRAVKEGLSPYTRKLHVDTRDGTVSISIQDFQDAIRPLIDRTIALVEGVLGETLGSETPPDRIVLTGGGTLLAAVPRMLREHFGRAKIHQGVYPFASVAIGAAIQAGLPELEITDRLSNHFGVLRVREDGSEYVDVIFEKGRPLPPPGQVETVIRPSYDPRFNIGRFQYLECNDVDPATGQALGDTVIWNEVLFPYDRAINPDGALDRPLDPEEIQRTDVLMEERIQEEYCMDEFGIITSRICRTVQDDYAICHNLYRRG